MLHEVRLIFHEAKLIAILMATQKYFVNNFTFSLHLAYRLIENIIRI